MERGVKRRPRQFSAAHTRFGFSMSGDTEDFIQHYVYVFGVWEPMISDWIAGHVRPGDIVVDVGANVGYHTLLAASLVGPAGSVVSFEPEPSIVDHLRRNVAANGFSNVTIVPKAVGGEPGATTIFRSSSANSGESSTIDRWNGAGAAGIEVERVRIGDEIAESRWSRIRLVKIDAEGDELAVLTGAAPVLEAMPGGSAVVIEISPVYLAERGISGEQVVACLAALGFTGYAIENDYDPRKHMLVRPPLLEPLDELRIEGNDAVFIKGG
jgi:FkbM family methyltransferase